MHADTLANTCLYAFKDCFYTQPCASPLVFNKGTNGGVARDIKWPFARCLNLNVTGAISDSLNDNLKRQETECIINKSSIKDFPATKWPFAWCLYPHITYLTNDIQMSTHGKYQFRSYDSKDLKTNQQTYYLNCKEDFFRFKDYCRKQTLRALGSSFDVQS